MEGIIVYTANIGDYDQIRDPNPVDPNVDYILFTDEPERVRNSCKHWIVREISDEHKQMDPQRAARYYKTHPFEVLPQHKYSVWVDSKYEVKVPDFQQFIDKQFMKNNIACYRHATGQGRTCLYEEAKVCQEAGLDSVSLIEAQMMHYRRQAFPVNHGLFDTAIIIRKNTFSVRHFDSLWWGEIERGSKRDQLSQVYVSWKTKIGIDPITFGGDVIYQSEFFRKHRHNHQLPKEPVTTEGITNVVISQTQIRKKRRRF